MIKSSTTSKNLTENKIEKEEIKTPSVSTINALLNFSKSLKISSSKTMGKMIVIGN